MVRLALLIIGILLHLSAWAADFTTRVDRTQVPINEPVLLTFTLTNSDTRLRAEGVDPNIDLSRLGKDFNLGRPEASNNYNIYLGQGRSTSEIKVELFPKLSGTLIIPAFEVDGLTSTPISITSLKNNSSNSAEVFIRSGSNLTTAWVGQQIVAWIDLYHRVELETASLGSNLETEPVQIELLSNWKMPQETRQEQQQQFDYEVERIAWAVFPNQAGEFTIHLPDIWVTTKTGKQLRLPQQHITLDVKPLPADVPADTIIGTPELTAEALPADFSQYTLSNWTVTLKAPVGVTALPRQLPGITLPDGLKLYPDPARYRSQQSSNGIMDVADYTLSIMPLQAGEFTLPAIRIPYFDPERGHAKLLELPEKKIKVNAANLPVPEAVITNAEKEDTTTTAPQINPWQISTAVLTLLWLATLYLWRRKQTTVEHHATAEAKTILPIQDKRHPLQQQLLAAMQSQTLETGLQQWLQHHPEDQVVLDAVRSVQRICYGHDKTNETEINAKVETAIRLIQKSPAQINSGKTDPWQAGSFYQYN